MPKADKRSKKPDWYRLDNAGVLYASITRNNYAPVYRMSAVMARPVEPAALQRAVDKTMPRFPGFRVRLKKGAFWYYFEPNDAPGPFVRQDMANPCQPIRPKEENGWLVRFFYYQRRISLEVFHAISDGGGSMVFFRTLLAVYLRELGYDIPVGDGVLDVEEPPGEGEMEDGYARYAGKKVLRGGWKRTAYPNTSMAEPFYTLNVTMGFMPVDKLKAAAKGYGATITEYLTAVLFEAILENQRKEGGTRPVALAIPIDLRRHFSTGTLRNFMLTIRPEVDPTLGEYTFQELVDYVRYFIRLHVDRREMRATFTGNVRFTTNPLLQVVPLWLKDPVMSFSYWLVAVRPYSATFTNPGVFRVGAAMEPHIQRMELILGQATRPSPHCACISYGNTLNVTFAGTGVSSETERRFFTRLVRDGVPVKIESNRTE